LCFLLGPYLSIPEFNYTYLDSQYREIVSSGAMIFVDLTVSTSSYWIGTSYTPDNTEEHVFRSALFITSTPRFRNRIQDLSYEFLQLPQRIRIERDLS
jgi:hypothetical protein